MWRCEDNLKLWMNRVKQPKQKGAARAGWFAFIALAVRLVHPQRVSADNHVELRREWYDEDNQRIHVDTTAADVEMKFTSSTSARAKVVYDSISGASPYGLPPPRGSTQVPL